MAALAAVLLAPGRLPVVVSGMPGVGKTYLVDRVFADNRVRFPGGYVRLSLDPQTQSGVTLPGVDELLAEIADRLKLPGAEVGPVLARLMDPLTLLHLENVDTTEAGRLAGIWQRFCRRPHWCSAPGCAGSAPHPAGARWRSIRSGTTTRRRSFAPRSAAMHSTSRTGRSWRRRWAGCRWRCTWQPGT
ncbi:MAG: hypothetical protein HWD60_07755 [Defluviicoccus sp.]|nr:MAG: hypothetical protein HWD60_07755 [Defluviicoccus sp.]